MALAISPAALAVVPVAEYYATNTFPPSASESAVDVESEATFAPPLPPAQAEKSRPADKAAIDKIFFITIFSDIYINVIPLLHKGNK